MTPEVGFPTGFRTRRAYRRQILSGAKVPYATAVKTAVPARSEKCRHPSPIPPQKKGPHHVARPPRVQYVPELPADEVALLKAPGADVQLLALAVDNDGDALDVGLERTGNRAVGVADGTTGNGVLLPQISQTFDMTLTSKVRRSRAR